MASRHLVDEELLAFLDMRPSIQLSAETLEATRAGFLEMRAQILEGFTPFPGIEKSERFVPGPEGAPEVRVLVFTPTKVSGPKPAFLHIHGGGYVLGDPDMREPSLQQYASDLGAVMVSVDYRLAPETPFPGPVEDCYAALKWLHTNADDLGIDRTRIAVGGKLIAGVLFGKARIRHHVEAVDGAGINMQLDRNAGARQPARIVEVLFQEEIERAGADEGRRQALEIFRARGSGIGRHAFPARFVPQQ